MRKFLTALVLIPLAIIFVTFAVANRHVVTVSFDPFNSINPSIGVKLPLFVVILVVAVLGVVAGGTASWLRQSRWRRAARQSRADAESARMELADARATTARLEAQRLPAVAGSDGPYSAGARDKRIATL